MDVSGWTLAERMELPDFCFPNRQLVGCYNRNDILWSREWEICDVALPDPVCIWEFAFMGMMVTNDMTNLRVGLAAAVPTNQAEMDAATEILPYFGFPQAGPNGIPLMSQTHAYANVPVKKGMISGGLKFVIENHNQGGTARVMAWILVSGLPTQVSNIFNPKIA